jgi:hypothetical protein
MIAKSITNTEKPQNSHSIAAELTDLDRIGVVIVTGRGAAKARYQHLLGKSATRLNMRGVRHEIFIAQSRDPRLSAPD